MQCTAKSKRSQERCKRRATPGKQVCNLHGGHALAGIASPTLKTGKYSKVLPARLLSTYEAAGQDTELLALREEIQVLDGRITDVLGRVDTGESGAIWRALKRALEEFRAALRIGDQDEIKTTLGELDRLIRHGLADYAAWADVRSLFQERRKLVESERKRMLEAQQYVAVEKALLFAQALAESVKTHVNDPKALAAIQGDITRLLGVGVPEQVRGG